MNRRIPILRTDQKTVELHGDGGDVLGPYFMRGGVCLPCLSTRAAGPMVSLEGIVLVAGLTEKDVLEVFEEHRFYSAGAVVRDGKLMDKGAAFAYNSGLVNYFCREYYIHQPEESVAQHQADLRKHRNEVGALPCLIDVEWTDVSTAETALLNRLHCGTLVMPKGGILHDALRMYSANRSEPPPAAWALMALCAGAARRPFRRLT